jgi:hypothetical protein
MQDQCKDVVDVLHNMMLTVVQISTFVEDIIGPLFCGVASHVNISAQLSKSPCRCLESVNKGGQRSGQNLVISLMCMIYFCVKIMPPGLIWNI